MELVEVDAVRAQPLQARLHALDDVVARSPGLLGLHPQGAELGGDHDALTPSLECPAHELLGLGLAVDVGGVEEVDPRVQRSLEHRFAGLVVDLHAEVVAAQPEDADFELRIPDAPLLHLSSPCDGWPF